MATCEKEDIDINFLPNEVIMKIFSYLTIKELICAVRLTCRRWFNVSYDRSIWTTLTTDDIKEFKDHSVYEIINRLFCFDDFVNTLKYLSLDRIDITHKEDLTCMFSVLIPNLCGLSLAFCQLVDKRIESFLERLSSCCHSIRCLNLEECNILNYSLKYFDKHNITKLNVSYCNCLTDEFLFTISHWNLKHLSIDGVQWISDKAVEHLLRSCQHSLEHLWLDGDNLTDEGLKMLRHCHNINVLKISYCEELTDVTLANVCEMQSLTSLSLRKGRNFSTEGLIFMFQNLKRGLYYLDFYDCQALNDEVTLVS